jgi:hypothetical protein
MPCFVLLHAAQLEYSEEMQYSLQRSVVQSTSTTTTASFSYGNMSGEQKRSYTPSQRQVVNVNIRSTSEQLVKAASDQSSVSQGGGHFVTPPRPILDEQRGSDGHRVTNDRTTVFAVADTKSPSSALCEAFCLLLPWMLLLFLLGVLLAAYFASLRDPGLFSRLWPHSGRILPTIEGCPVPEEPLECLFCGENTVI